MSASEKITVREFKRLVIEALRADEDELTLGLR